MKIRVPFAWFWYGEDQYGTPEVESGTIAAANPQPPEQVLAQLANRMTSPGPRLPAGEPPPLDAGPLPAPPPEPPLAPYMTPKHRAQHQQTIEERLAQLEDDLERAREGRDPNWKSR